MRKRLGKEEKIWIRRLKRLRRDVEICEEEPWQKQANELMEMTRNVAQFYFQMINAIIFEIRQKNNLTRKKFHFEKKAILNNKLI